MKTENYIGGVWRGGRGAAFASRDPATSQIVWSGAAADTQDIAEGAHAASAAFPAWAARTPEERIAIAEAFARIVKARADLFAETISREMGKPLWDSRGEVSALIAKIAISVRAQAERAGAHETAAPFGRLALTHRPHGVLAVFGPFNFPAHLPNGHITPALLAGDTVLFKPSELAPATGALMVEAWEEAGLPAGVLNLLQGGSETGAALLDAPGLAGVLFTGSERTGVAIHRHFAGRPEILVALEMGGNNPLIVWPPYDEGAAANLIIHSAFITSGQRCSCARRLIAPQGPAGDRLIEALAAATGALAPAPWTAAPEPFMGPLVTARAAAQAGAFEADLIGRGARAIVASQHDGAFQRPALVDVTDTPARDEECFAPLLQIVRVPTFAAGIACANDTRFGLAGAVISEDGAIWAQARRDLRVGVLNWNRPTTGASSALPFGGFGRSGSLRPSAYYAADYTAHPVASQISETIVKLPAPGLPL